RSQLLGLLAVLPRRRGLGRHRGRREPAPLGLRRRAADRRGGGRPLHDAFRRGPVTRRLLPRDERPPARGGAGDVGNAAAGGGGGRRRWGQTPVVAAAASTAAS